MRRPLLFIIHSIVFIVLLSPSVGQTDTAGDANWTMFRGNPEHTGRTSLIGPPEESEVKWRWRIAYETSPISASPILDKENMLFCATEGGYLAGLSTSGGNSWVYPLDGGVLATPAVDQSGNVCVITSDGYIYQFNSSGELQWKCDLGIGITSSPVISGTTAYVGTNSNGLFALRLDPDLSQAENASKRLLKWDILEWSFLAQGQVTCSPAFAGNTVFFAGGTKLYALNPIAGSSDNTTEKVKWSYDINSSIKSSPAVYNGVVYVGADDGYLYAFKENVETGTKRGELLWKRKTGGSVQSSPAIATPAAGETDTTVAIYVGSDDGKLYALSNKGDLLWTFPTLGQIRSSPTIDGNGDIYFGSDDGAVYALYPDGSLKWKIQTGGKVRSSPVIGPDKTLYIGSDDGLLYCIGESTEENREYDFTIDVSLSLAAIENNGNPTTIAARISSEKYGKDVLSRIASVTIDLSSLNLIGVLSSSDPLFGDFEIGALGVERMLDDGLYEDDVAGDGLFTYAFGLTDDAAFIGWDEGIYTHYPALGPLGVGPVPLMVTVTDLYGNRTSKPFVLKIDQKMRGVPPFEDSILSILNNQTLSISFTSGTPSILSIVPSKGSPGQRLNVAILGKNTNFTKNRTRIEIFNNAGIRIAYALPERDDVDVLSDVSLNATLNIVNTDEVKTGGLVGRWDIKVTTEFAEGGDEVVIGKDLFEISASATASMSARRADTSAVMQQQEQTCRFGFDITDDQGARPKGAPYAINIGYPRTITIERARAGIWNYMINLSDCQTTPSFKIITTGGNFGYVTGEVRDGITGKGIDNATISAITGDETTSPANTSTSAGGGYYLLPLAASEQNYTVIARKDGLIDLHRDVKIVNGKETKLNFSLKPEFGCPLTDLAQPELLPFFYWYRDKILATTPEGRHLISLYYKHAPEVRKILASSPELSQRFRRLVLQTAQDFAALPATGALLRSETRRDFFEVLDMITSHASHDLRHCITQERVTVVRFLNR